MSHDSAESPVATSAAPVVSIGVPFSLAAPGRYVQEGCAVYPNSLLFRAGSYPDKRFEATAGDLKRMQESINVRNPTGNIEHKDFLRGRAGVIVSAWTEEDDQILRGVVRVPLALDSLLESQERQVSLEIDRDTKAIRGFALTTDPRVSDAVLMSLDMRTDPTEEFSRRHDTRRGQMAMQEMHDAACRYGAVCRQANASMSSAHEAKAIQSMHDLACEHGAMCEDRSNSQAETPACYSKTDKGPLMTMKERIQALFRRAGVSEDEIDGGLADVEFVASGSEREDASRDRPGESLQVRRLQEQIAQMSADRRQAQATAWADGEIAAGRADPAEREMMVAMYARAAEDDVATPATVTFSSQGRPMEASRVETLKALFAGRQPHDLLREILAQGRQEELMVAFNRLETARQGQAGTMTAERRRLLLASTPEGRAILKSEGK